MWHGVGCFPQNCNSTTVANSSDVIPNGFYQDTISVNCADGFTGGEFTCSASGNWVGECTCPSGSGISNGTCSQCSENEYNSSINGTCESCDPGYGSAPGSTTCDANTCSPTNVPNSLLYPASNSLNGLITDKLPMLFVQMMLLWWHDYTCNPDGTTTGASCTACPVNHFSVGVRMFFLSFWI